MSKSETNQHRRHSYGSLWVKVRFGSGSVTLINVHEGKELTPLEARLVARRLEEAACIAQRNEP